MHGVSLGETVGPANPLIVAYFRQGGELVDPFSVDFRIDEIRDPASAAVELEASASLDLVTNKLGTGRYAIPFTADSEADPAYQLGTCRVVVTYTLEDGGPSFVETIPFEVLDSGEYATGAGYVGYLSTREVYRRGLATISAAAPSDYHPTIKQVSLGLESLLGQPFHPVYRKLRVDGSHTQKLLLPMTLVALEGLYTIAEEADGSERFTEIVSSSNGRLVVYNRHLDSGPDWDDDRDSPAISIGSNFWMGRRFYEVRGVWGFTDPMIDAAKAEARTGLGVTPEDLVDVVVALMIRAMDDPTYTSLATHQPGRVKKYQTRHQAIEFAAASGSVSYGGGLTGDMLLDQKLARLMAPARAEYIDRRELPYFDAEALYLLELFS
jgi:hypothetical protein